MFVQPVLHANPGFRRWTALAQRQEGVCVCVCVCVCVADEIARESDFDLGMLRVFVDELEGLSARARRRRVVALRSFLERAEACVSVYTPAEVAILAEIQVALL